MSQFFLILLLLFLTILEKTLVPLNLVLLVLVFLAIYRPIKEVFWLAFITGLAVDLAGVSHLGVSSLAFCLVIFIFHLYSHRFSSRHPLFIMFFVLLSDLSLSRCLAGNIQLASSVILSLLAGGLILSGRLWGLMPEESIRLKV